MREFNYIKLTKLLLPMETVQLLSKLNEYKGKQDLYKKQAPQLLNALKDVAIIQSTKASNAIEGIVITDRRFQTIMKDKTDLLDRSEGEIAGYKEVLELIHSSYEAIPTRSSVILQLHKEMYKYIAAEGGRWKQSDNVISETLPDGTTRIRFEPLSSFETPRAMERICEEFQIRKSKQDVDPLILTSVFILDFLSIHPFHDGNGRMARLLTLLLLYTFGYEVGRFISLEKVVEDTKEGYYESLRQSSIGWHSDQNDLIPWINYLLSTFIAAYKQLEDRVGILETQTGGKSQRIHSYIESKIGYFTKSDIKEACPDISEATINRVLTELRAEGQIEAVTRGRSAKWRKL